MGILGKNDPCYCGSGKKHKKYCLNKDFQDAPSEELQSLLNTPAFSTLTTPTESVLSEMQLLIGDYIDHTAEHDDPVLTYLVPDMKKWTDFRNDTISIRQIDTIIDIAKEHKLINILDFHTAADIDHEGLSKLRIDYEKCLSI
jgi:hypothetical protein